MKLQTNGAWPTSSIILLTKLMNFLKNPHESVIQGDFKENEDTADTEPVSLERRISREVSSANAWYEINGMIANLSKHQGMILGKTNHLQRE